jgi:putative transposase
VVEQTTTRKTYKFKLKPTLEQERQFDTILWRCRTVYNTALEQRKTIYVQRGISVTYYQ